MIRRVLVGLGVGLVLVAIHPMSSEAAGALLWPSDPITLTAAGDTLTTTVEVSNPTDADVTVVAAAQGTAANANACLVTITDGATVLTKRTSTVSITVAAVPTVCDDPTDGSHELILAEADGTTVELAIRKTAAKPEDPKPTGIIWPTDVFLHRRDSTLAGSFTVVNPTEAAIMVTAPTFADGCEQVLPGASRAVAVPPRGEAKIQVTGPGNCRDLDSTTIVATAFAQTADGAKSDAAKLTFAAEVDWGPFGWALGICVGAGVLLAMMAAIKFTGVSAGKVLRIDSTSPPGWLTSTATIGTLLTALASTTGLPKGLFGSDALPQQTLILGAAAVSLLLVGVAGLITGIPLKRETVEGKEQTCPFAWQFALGAGMSAAAAALQVWAVTMALSRLDLPILGVVITIGRYVALAAAGIYLVVTVHHYVKTYGTDPTKKDPVPSDALVAVLTEMMAPSGATPDVVAEAGVKANQVAVEIARRVDDGVAQKSAPTGSAVRPSFSRNFI